MSTPRTTGDSRLDATPLAHEPIPPTIQVRNVVGVFERLEVAEAAISKLLIAGCRTDEISVASLQPGAPPHLGTRETHVGGAVAACAATGALLGGAIVLVALVIPGIGPMFAAGELLALATATVTGGTIGALVGSFAGLGIPTEHAKRYEDAVRSGAVVVTVRTADEKHARDVEAQLRVLGAHETAIYQPAL